MTIAFLMILVFSEGIAVGSGIVALLTLLDVIPRLCQVSKTYKNMKLYEIMLILGSFLGSITSLTNFHMNFGKCSMIFSGFFYGIFVGLLAIALAEALDVIPVMERRLNIQGSLNYIVWSLLLGKICGAIINFTILNKIIMK